VVRHASEHGVLLARAIYDAAGEYPWVIRLLCVAAGWLLILHARRAHPRPSPGPGAAPPPAP
jgi:hypothetical protein